METLLIDTNIIVGRMRLQPAALSALERVQGHPLAICDAVLAEILTGARNRAEYDRLLGELNTHFHSLPMVAEVSTHFRTIMATTAREQGVHFADYLIAATALAHDCALLTLN